MLTGLDVDYSCTCFDVCLSVCLSSTNTAELTWGAVRDAQETLYYVQVHMHITWRIPLDDMCLVVMWAYTTLTVATSLESSPFISLLTVQQLWVCLQCTSTYRECSTVSCRSSVSLPTASLELRPSVLSTLSGTWVYMWCCCCCCCCCC